MTPYSHYKYSGVNWIGEIPSHWSMPKTSYILDYLGSGTTPRTNNEDYYNGEVPWVTTGELRECLITDTKKKLSIIALKDNSSLKLHPVNSIVIAMYGATIGRLAKLGVQATTNQACCVLPPSKKINTEFLYFWLMGHRDEIVELGYGGGQPNISQETISNIRITLPPISEQILIQKFLEKKTSHIDRLIQEKQQFIRLLEEKRQALISDVVTKGLDDKVEMKDSGVEFIGAIPKHWIVSPLKYLTSKIGSGKTPSGGAEAYVQSGVTFLRSQNIYNDGLRLKDVVFIPTEIHESMKNSAVKLGDVLLNITGGSIGRSCLFDLDISDINVNQHVCIIRSKNSELSEFLALVFQSGVVSKQVAFSQTGAGREGLNFVEIGMFGIPLPPISECMEITSYCQEKAGRINSILEETRKSMELLVERRSALISAAVTGKIDVREAV
jgi:type I restriction enzyme S subunit